MSSLMLACTLGATMSEYEIPQSHLECYHCEGSVVEIEGGHDDLGLGMSLECCNCGHTWHYEVSIHE